MMFFCLSHLFVCFFFNGTSTTEIYTLSLHDALPIYLALLHVVEAHQEVDDRGLSGARVADDRELLAGGDRKSTRLNSSHVEISYAVFCLKKKRRRCPRSDCLNPRSRAAVAPSSRAAR